MKIKGTFLRENFTLTGCQHSILKMTVNNQKKEKNGQFHVSSKNKCLFVSQHTTVSFTDSNARKHHQSICFISYYSSLMSFHLLPIFYSLKHERNRKRQRPIWLKYGIKMYQENCTILNGISKSGVVFFRCCCCMKSIKKIDGEKQYANLKC